MLRKPDHYSKLRVERLEGRWMLAGNVTVSVANGGLILRGGIGFDRLWRFNISADGDILDAEFELCL